MSTIPLYLQVKASGPLGSSLAATPEQTAATPLFQILSDTTIEFQDKQYDFTKIYNGSCINEFRQMIDSDESSCFIFMGPTASGKTTTLKRVLNAKVAQLANSKTISFITAFELTANKHIGDLLGGTVSKVKYLQSFENHLRKEKVDCLKKGQDALAHIFSKRSTSRTAFNDKSSRSCLIVTFSYNNKRMTYIDLMGNEKFQVESSNIASSPSHSNRFANLNISSITQLLTKKSLTGRSSNLITNLIFKKEETIHNTHIILHLDKYGDESLAKSTLHNIADLVSSFTLSSPFKSPQQTSKKYPHYAMPTASSQSPIRMLFASRKKLNSPAKLKLVPKLRRPLLATKLLRSPTTPPSSNSFVFSSPVQRNGPAFKEQRELILDFNAVQIANLKKTIQELELDNEQLKGDVRELVQQLTAQLPESNNELTLIESDSQIVQLRSKIEQLRKINDGNDQLIEQQRAIVTDIKDSMKAFKEDYGQFKTKILAIRDNMSDLDQQNQNLHVQMKQIRDELELSSMNNSTLKSEYEKEQALRESNQSQLEEALSKLQTLSLDLDTAQQQKLAVEEERNAKVSEIEELQSSLKSVRSDKEQLVTDLRILQEQKDQLEVQLGSLQSELSEGNEKTSTLRNDIDSVNKKMEELTAELQGKESTITLLNSTLEEKEEVIRSLTATIENCEISITELKNTIADNETKISSLMEQLDEQSSIIEQLKTNLVTEQQLSQTLQLQINEKNSEIASLRQELEQTKEELKSINLQFQNSKETVAMENEVQFGFINDQLKQKNSQIEKMNAQLSQRDNQISSLNNKIAGLESDLQASHSKYESATGALNIQVIEQNSELADKNHEIAVLRNKVVDLESQAVVNAETWPVAQSHQNKFNDNLLGAPLLNKMDMLYPEAINLSKSPFNPSDIFQDTVNIREGTPDSYSSSASSSPDKSKNVLAPSNNYKSLIHAMSKEKKHKRKGSNIKNKSNKRISASNHPVTQF